MGYYDDVLEHHGILGQKWGVRRFENKNGHLTAAGLKRYTTDANGDYQKVKKSLRTKRLEKAANAAQRDADNLRKHGRTEEADAVQKIADKNRAKAEDSANKKGLSDKQKKLIVAGAAVAGTALAAYGGYKLYQLNNKAKQGLSEQYHQKAVNAFSTSNKLDSKGFDLHDQGFKLARSSGADEANKMMNEGVRMMREAKDLRNTGYKYQDKAKAGKFSLKEKADYLAAQKNSNLSSKEAVKKVRQQYAKDQANWYKKTINLEQQRNFAERMGNTNLANKIDKKLASSPPPLPPSASKKGVAATNRLASDASALARSVTAEGPKSFSKPAQNGGQSRPQSSAQQLKANRVSNGTMTSGSNTISRTMKASGQTTFNQASKANDDFVNDLLKKNAKALGL